MTLAARSFSRTTSNRLHAESRFINAERAKGSPGHFAAIEPSTICKCLSYKDSAAADVTYSARKYMGEKEPQTFSKLRMLRVKTLDQANERASARISCQYGRCILATERIFLAIFYCASKEATVQVKYTWEVRLTNKPQV